MYEYSFIDSKNDISQKAIELLQLLVQSGRQIKHNFAFIAAALLDGYLRLLSAYEPLQYITLDEIAPYVKQFQEKIFA